MRLKDIKAKLPDKFYSALESQGIDELRPSQEKSVKAGLLDGKNLLVCTPTASGKTLIAELAMIKSIVERKGKAIYIVPLRALANEKFSDFNNKYGDMCKVALSTGDLDSADTYLMNYNLIVCTSEKLDSLIRHHSPWLKDVGVVVVDEIHLLNDASRGPTLELLMVILKKLLKNIQIIGLSATIGNPEELSEWLDANLVQDSWRPVELHQGILFDNEIEYYYNDKNK
jgi:helicase